MGGNTVGSSDPAGTLTLQYGGVVDSMSSFDVREIGGSIPLRDPVEIGMLPIGRWYIGAQSVSALAFVSHRDRFPWCPLIDRI